MNSQFIDAGESLLLSFREESLRFTDDLTFPDVSAFRHSSKF